MSTDVDIVIVGAGHNGLTAAAYLAASGRSVTVLERRDVCGGAAVSTEAFTGVDARLSRYSYLVSLLPERIVNDLGLDIRLARRRYSSYTPKPGQPEIGLLVDTQNDDATAASFARVGEADSAAGFARFYRRTHEVAQAVWPTMTEPLITRSEMKSRMSADVWDAFFESPLGNIIRLDIAGDIARGVALTDGLIGTFASADDPSLDQNRCFLYHVIGRGTGDWDVPVGGMGTVTAELERAAREAGAHIVTAADVTAVRAVGDAPVMVTYRHENETKHLTAGRVLMNVSPWVMDELVGRPSSHPRPEGAQIKVNMLLTRLPRLADAEVSPEQAFGGTFHINETWEQLQDAYDQAAAGRIPVTLPCEIYCHSLTDPSILSRPLQEKGYQTLTVFGLHVPHSLQLNSGKDVREQLTSAVLRSLNSVLAEPVEDLLATDALGRPCIEAKTTADLEEALNMTGGNIFHAPLEWPFVEDGEDLTTPQARWGVDTGMPRVYQCGSGSRRGGAVSGLGGFSAAMAVFEADA